MADASMNRRSFLAASGAAVAAGIAAGGATSAYAVAPGYEPEQWDYDVDVAVAGAGYAGLTAAATAAEAGATSVMVEACSRTGGSGLAATIGFGFLKYQSYESCMKANPTADPELAKVIWDAFFDIRDWFTEEGVPCSYNDGFPNYILLEPLDRNGNIAMADALAKIYEDHGGTIVYNTRAVALYTDADGAVTGMKCIGADGKPVNIKAKATILCNGGFQNDPQMKQQFLGKNADLIQNQGDPYNDGTGIRMGLAAGGRLSKSMDTFTGIPQAYPPIIPITVEDWEECISSVENLTEFNECCTGLQLGQSILINLNGRRFVDESLGECISGKGIAEQPYGRCFYVMDSEMRADVYQAVGRTGLEAERELDVLDYIAEKGGHIYSGDTIEELAAAMAAGTDCRVDDGAFSMSHLEGNAQAIVQTIEEYNKAVDEGTTALLTPPRLYDARKIEAGPFYAIEATAGTYMTCGGLKVDTSFEVLGNGDYPVPGLYAACCVAGGIMGKIHWAVLCHQFGSGRIAGKAAAAYALEE